MKSSVPNWFKKASVYQINPRTFSREGTINAVTEQLMFLAELGFGIMYLCPIFEEDASDDKKNWSARQKASNTENPKNPYRINNYFEIDSEYGTMNDLKEFVRRAHELGLKVVLDLVYLHIGPNAKIFESHPEFAKRDEEGNIVLTRWNFPYLNYESEGLREYLYCNMTYYIGEIGVDGFRCDVGDEVPLDFWRESMRRIRAINPDSVMINEGESADHLTVFDANYGFSWHESIYELLNQNIPASEVIARHQSKADKYRNKTCGVEEGLVLRDMDNHDTVTDWPYRIEEHFGHECMELILALNYTIDGIPMVYCGNEIADTAKLNMFANRFYMGDFETTDRNATGEAVERRKVLIRTLNALKLENRALQEGKTVWLNTCLKSVLAFRRVVDNECILFVGNFSDMDVEIDIDLDGETILENSASSNNGKLNLEKYGYVVCRRSDK